MLFNQLARIPYFEGEKYYIIRKEIYASKYKNKCGSNDVADVDINRLISFEPSHIKNYGQC